MKRLFSYLLAFVILSLPVLAQVPPYNISTFISAASGNALTGVATATLAAVPLKTTYITGFDVTGSGATVGLPAICTVSNIIGGTLSYTYTFVAGALLPNQALNQRFNPPLPANAVNTSIVVSCTAGGLGVTNQFIAAYGFQQ